MKTLLIIESIALFIITTIAFSVIAVIYNSVSEKELPVIFSVIAGFFTMIFILARYHRLLDE